MMAESTEPAILHVIVVGFHHKKGCQVEYSFPPLVEDSPNECPLGWKYLPTLALPDGSHNYNDDTVYFHLPSLKDPNRTVFGVSCFKQIPVEKIKNKTSDITRGTVQKSVCALSSIPLYGYVQVKMALITHAYFDEGDFSKVSLLEDTYHHLNSCMSSESHIPSQIFLGLSARDFIIHFRHKALLLFKLLLLERRIVFYQSPVQPLCSAILTLLSLYPAMLESGLQQSACVRPSRPMSPIPNFDDDNNSTYFQDDNINDEMSSSSCEIGNIFEPSEKLLRNKTSSSLDKNDNNHRISSSSRIMDVVVETGGDCLLVEEEEEEENFETPSSKDNDNGVVHRVQSANTITLGMPDSESNLPRDVSSDTLADARLSNTIAQIARLNPDLCGMPLELFTKGYLCLPYLSLPYLDLLADENVQGYIVGATNILFKQKKQLIDVLVESESARIEATDPDLRRQLHLTTEDLRFADYIVRHVTEPKNNKDDYSDEVDWAGSDEWIRMQFRVYLLSLLRTSIQQDARQMEHFNSYFISAWKKTNNYDAWLKSNKSEIDSIEVGHPFAGQLSVQDMKLRLSHTMQNTEGGRKLNQAMMSTGKAVANTGKAVGGAISQAKGAFSSWWSTLTTVQTIEVQVKSDSSPIDDNEIVEPSSEM